MRVSENTTESYHKRAMVILQAAGPAGMAKSDFTRRTQFMEARQRDNILRTLVDAGLIEIEPFKTGNRVRQMIKCIRSMS